MAEPAETRNFFPSLQRNVTPTSSASTVVSYTSNLGHGPILTLIHGYPQSALIWRHVVPALLNRVSLFIPELPGYGISTPAAEHSKKVVGLALLEALQSTIPSSPTSPRNLILAGHDRGARICHRLVVDQSDLPASLTLVGAIFLDIIPTKSQWDKFSNPDIAQGYFHWPLLANVELATKMLMAYGGGNWARDANTRLMGKSEEARARMMGDGAVDVYAALFEKEETLRGSCEDYSWGAGREYREQERDQEEGRKIGVPLLVMFSKEGLGGRIDVEKEWRDWVAKGVEYEGVAIGPGVGHYLPEEAHDVVSEKVLEFLGKHGGE
ncbi:alpha/beta hydrolase [Podospora aff. communis PSN243]|uniref:Alpha/beta hydrolase n=1 Tax=Podospora aff. communis PSN243 TaxID=3040156 RepID=A0AAV9GFY7_9PEZI|nr:alpha/beta hydrolase [Podospora aff. communis PSN243]